MNKLKKLSPLIEITALLGAVAGPYSKYTMEHHSDNEIPPTERELQIKSKCEQERIAKAKAKRERKALKRCK